jgi:hypothetical protein
VISNPMRSLETSSTLAILGRAGAMLETPITAERVIPKIT